ncbi:MAG: 6-carboxytetrahydropterin synthase [Bacteroidales bacterium]|jgi:6-pyruvoyltetrahydropterin/6-carboxytetrahydropterin synthase|nr:6-carboxytetrahydropterin synthase [Bacteroidales bacterium]
MKIRVTKEFGFESSHALQGYDGLCSNIHGHSYKLFITIKGTPCEDEKSPKYGMVMDFADLKAIVRDCILDDFDHALVLQKGSSFARLLCNAETKTLFVPYRPTCENMLLDFVAKISKRLPTGVDLAEIRLHETATSFAQWVMEDNV